MRTRIAPTLGLVALFTCGWCTRAHAADLFVSTSGDDTHAGTSSAPFKTIGHCASVAMPGDTCRIGAGDYAEMIKPAHSGTSGAPITFAPSSTTSPTPVTLSGRATLGGWTKSSGNIWKTSVAAGTDVSELFVDGARMIVARSPNLASGDEYRPTFWTTGSDGDVNYIVDTTHLTQPAGYWSGAKMYIVAGLGWESDLVSVTGYDAATHRIDFSPAIAFGAYYKADKESRYYLYGQLQLLDAAGEWFFDSTTNTVYLWPPASDDPSKHVVERTAAASGLDLTGLSYIEVDGLTIASGRVVMTNSTHCKLDGVRVLYGQSGAESGFGNGGQVVVSGSDNEIVRSEIAYAPGRCVDLGGTRNALRASLVHHCDAEGSYAQIVRLSGKQNTIEDCALHDTGRDGIGTTGSGTIDGSIIQHNELYDTALIDKDTGAFYTFQTDGGGTVLRYNVVHGVRPAPTEAYGGTVMGFGIYFDDGSSGYVAHHNLVYDVGYDGMFLHQPSNHIVVYNNTVVGSGDTATSGNAISTEPGSGGPSATGSILENNLAVLLDDRNGWCIDIGGTTPTYDHNGYFQLSGKGKTNRIAVEPTGVVADPKFVDATKNQFALASGSPMIDKGVVVAGITDGYVGAAPDIGAFENGGKETPGPRVPPGPPPPPGVDAGADAETGGLDGGGDAIAQNDASGDAPSTDGASNDASSPSGDGSSSSGGCGCRLDASSPSSMYGSIAGTALLALFAMRRRRRSHR